MGFFAKDALLFLMMISISYSAIYYVAWIKEK